MRFKEWKKEITENWRAMMLAVLFLAISLTIYSIAGTYVDYSAQSAVSDIILDNIPATNIPYLYVYGFSLVLGVIFFYPLIFKPKMFSYTVFQLSLLILIRNFFIILTHLKVPSTALLVDVPVLYKILAFDNDLFFSNHTAVPFLGALLFRGNLRMFFSIMTVLLAMMVLVMHLHYSIDVFAAFFITYGSYKLGQAIFYRIK